MKTFLQKILGLAGGLLVATAASAQNFDLDWSSLDNGSGTSTGAVFAMSTTLGPPEPEPMSGGSFTLSGQFMSLMAAGPATGATATFFTPTASTPAYLQFSNSPFFGIDFSSGYFYLETFEDDALNTPGVTATNGSIIGVEDFGSLVDSVDADDGVIDGTGQTGGVGRSYFGGAFTFVFDPAVLGSLPTHVGIVWTDGSGAVTIEAFDAGGSSLGQATGVVHADGSISGTTADDRFYGVMHEGGISRIILSSSTQEADHLQYGFAGSTPSELRITAVRISGNELRFGFPTSSGRTYVIESRANLAAGEWAEVPGSMTTGSGAEAQVIVQIALTSPQQFYRVKQLP